MNRVAIIVALMLVPFGVFAATTAAAQNLVFTKPIAPLENAYLAGGTVIVTSPAPADLVVVGVSSVMSAFVEGDLSAVGGSVAVRARVKGDLRAVGGRISIGAPVTGDLVVVGASVDDKASNAKDILAMGGSVRLESGSRGTVRVYGNEIHLAGTFNGNVRAVAFDKLILAPGTVIHGSLKYEASESATIPSSVRIDDKVTYTGASFLPTSQEAAAFALAGIGIFFLVRILGALIIAGLLAGLFPVFTNKFALQVFHRSVRHVLLLALLGFGIVVATPVLIILLAITFVGLGIAFILASAYLLLLVLAFAYAGIIVGATFSNVFMKREIVSWRDAVFGMLVLMVVSIVPTFGSFVLALLVCLATGVITSLFYKFAFHNALRDLV